MLAIHGPDAPGLVSRFSARADLPRLFAAIAAIALAASLLAIAACADDANEAPILEDHPITIEITSTAFEVYLRRRRCLASLAVDGSSPGNKAPGTHRR